MCCTFITSTAAFSCMCGTAWFIMFVTTMDDHLRVSLNFTSLFSKGFQEEMIYFGVLGTHGFAWQPSLTSNEGIGNLPNFGRSQMNFWTPNWSTRILNSDSGVLFLLNRPENLESSHMNQWKGKREMKWTKWKGMAVRSTRRPTLDFLTDAFRKLNWQMPSQRMLVRLHQSWSQHQHQYPRRSLLLWLCIKTWNIKLVLPWKLTYPLNIDAWKMTFPFELVPFQGIICFFLGGSNI